MGGRAAEESKCMPINSELRSVWNSGSKDGIRLVDLARFNYTRLTRGSYSKGEEVTTR